METPSDPVNDIATTLLELLGLLLLAAGAVAALVPVIGWASLAVGGVVLIGGSFVVQLPSLLPRKSKTENDPTIDDRRR